MKITDIYGPYNPLGCIQLTPEEQEVAEAEAAKTEAKIKRTNAILDDPQIKAMRDRINRKPSATA